MGRGRRLGEVGRVEGAGTEWIAHGLRRRGIACADMGDLCLRSGGRGQTQYQRYRECNWWTEKRDCM
jgi:hypothetical protein